MSLMMKSDAPQWMLLHLAALYTYNKDGFITVKNLSSGHQQPRFHLMRSHQIVKCCFREDMPHKLISTLQNHVASEPLSVDLLSLPIFYDSYKTLLEGDEPISAIWSGPVYHVPSINEQTPKEYIEINHNNRHLLSEGFENWAHGIEHRQPTIAILKDGKIAAICASVRTTQEAHVAGVETLPKYKNKGFAKTAVKRWSQAVQTLGKTALYSTSWENKASQGLANSLGLEFVGADFHIT